MRKTLDILNFKLISSMLKKSSNQFKFRLAIILFAFLIWVCYQLAISKTVILWKEVRIQEHQKELIKEIPEQLPVLIQQVEKLESVLGNSEDADFSTLILEQISMLCQQNNIILKEIPEKHQFQGENILIETVNVNLQGNFRDQLLLISSLEKNITKARIRSLRFQSVSNQISGERQLQSIVYLQSIHLLSNKSNYSDNEKSAN
jgi:hypothetical protein